MARQKVSSRDFIDANGQPVDKIELATGARYALVKRTGGTDDKPEYANEHEFDVQLGEAGKPATMYAIFGAWTKLGNVANSVLNDDKEPGTIDDAADEIAAFIKSVESGVWREAGDGAARGPKYDNDVLGIVLHAILGAAAKGDAASYTARLAADKGYRAKVVARDDIKAAYWVEMSKRGVAKPQASTDSLA